MDNDTILEIKELLQRLVDVAENSSYIPQWDTVIALFALIASWITIIFLLKERQEKSRPYLEVSFELVRSTLACIVLKNTGTCPLEIKSLKFNDTFINQLPSEVQVRLKNKEKASIIIFPNRKWVMSFNVNVFEIISNFEEKKVKIHYIYKKLKTHKKIYKEHVIIDFEEYNGMLIYISDIDEFKNSIDKLNESVKKCIKISAVNDNQHKYIN